jgi:hypothetical protein
VSDAAGVGRRFSRLAFAAIDDPTQVDRNELLAVADEMIRYLPDRSDPGVAAARRMANLALEWCVFGTAKTLYDFYHAARAFSAHT